MGFGWFDEGSRLRGGPGWFEEGFHQGSTRVPPGFHQGYQGSRVPPVSSRVPPAVMRAGWFEVRFHERVPRGSARAVGWS